MNEAELRQQPIEALVVLVLRLQAEVATLRADLAQRDGRGPPPRLASPAAGCSARGWQRW